MNITLTFRTLALFAILSLVLGVQSCSKLEDLASGTAVYIETDVLLNPLTIQIVDANLGTNLPEHISVEVKGKDKDKIFSVMGERTLYVDTNRDDEVAAILPIGIRRIETFSPENPIEFTLIFSAEGYMPLAKSFSIESETNHIETVHMLNMNTPVQGVSKKNDDFIAPLGGIHDNIHLNSNMNQESEMVEVDMKSGTELYDVSGNRLSGEVSVELFHYDVHSGKALDVLPGGIFVSNARDKQGNSLGATGLSPLGAISLDMYVGGKEVSAFSEPIEVTFHLNGDMINPNTDQKVQEGDILEVWSFNETIAEWQQEGDVTVSRNPSGELVASYLQPHLSTWIVGGSRGCRALPTRINITNADIDENDGERFYLTGLYRADNDELVAMESFRYFDGESIRLVRVSAFDCYFKIFEGQAEDCLEEDNPLFTSDVFETCGDIYDVDLTGVLSSSDFVDITVEVAGSCTSDFNDLVVKPTLPILYRPEGCNTWNTLGILQSGKGNTSALQKGEFYDFRISYRGLERCLLGLQVPVSNTTIDIDSPVYDFQETIDVVYSADGKTLTFIYTDIEVPDLACQEYIDAFGVGSGGNGRPLGDDD